MRKLESEIQKRLYELQDLDYRAFQAKLTPDLKLEDFIGVRTPALRSLAKEVGKREDVKDFLQALPHSYFDENQIHAFLISEMKDYGEVILYLNDFLPYVNNWATCDQLRPKCFKKHKEELLTEIKKWITSEKVYTVRFAIGMLMAHFLDENFTPEYLDMVAGVKSDQYYINMMIAWYFATALSKQYDATIPFVVGRKMDVWTHNKTIQKAVESYRITPEKKEYLKSLRRKTR